MIDPEGEELNALRKRVKNLEITLHHTREAAAESYLETNRLRKENLDLRIENGLKLEVQGAPLKFSCYPGGNGRGAL